MFFSAQKYAIFVYILAFHSIRAITTLTMVDYGSPRLRITKNGLFNKQKMVPQGRVLIRWDI